MNEPFEILRYFDPVLFCPSLTATDKRAALREMVRIVTAGKDVRDPDLLLEMLERRESLGSTGIGKGVAIPHGRSLAVVHLKVVFGRSEKGIDFDAIDGKPVRLFFLIVAPPQDERNEYLPLLGRIAELVKDKKVRDRLLKVTDFGQLRTVLEDGALHVDKTDD